MNPSIFLREPGSGREEWRLERTGSIAWISRCSGQRGAVLAGGGADGGGGGGVGRGGGGRLGPSQRHCVLIHFLIKLHNIHISFTFKHLHI